MMGLSIPLSLHLSVLVSTLEDVSAWLGNYRAQLGPEETVGIQCRRFSSATLCRDAMSDSPSGNVSNQTFGQQVAFTNLSFNHS